MYRNNRKLLVFSVIVGLIGVLFFSNAYALTLKANQVANLTTKTLYTVPSGYIAKVTSVIISTEGANTAYDQRLYRSGTDVTSYITVPGSSTIQLQFNPEIVFTAGQTIQVRNGASNGPTNFTVVIQVDAL